MSQYIHFCTDSQKYAIYEEEEMVKLSLYAAWRDIAGVELWLHLLLPQYY